MSGERLDAIVIGAGPNGLAAAIRLADAGRAVLVLEASDRPGGALRTEELTLPGFHHDVFSAVHPAAAASPVFARMGLERHGLRWVHPEVAMAHVLDGGRAAVLMRDLDATAASLDALHAGDGAAWRAFAAPLVEHFDALRHTMLAGFPPLRGPLRLLAGLRLQGTLDFAQLLISPASALAGRLFAGEAAAAWLYGAALHGDVPPDDTGSAISGVYLNLLGHAVGWPSPEGGAARLAEALAGRLRDSDGATRTGARVTRVLARQGRVEGVEIEGGELVRARIVIADVGVPGLLALAADALQRGYTARLRRFRPGPATLKLDWALDAPIPWEAEAARRAGTVHVGGGPGEIRAWASALRAGRVPERPFLLAGQQSLADPTRAPAGGHTAWAYTHVPSRELDAEAVAAAVEAQVERFAPGFRARVLARHVLTPAALQARNPNLVDGDVGGGSYALDQLVFRPVAKLSPYRTPLRGLYLGSASAFPGGAVHGVPGHAAAGAALADDRLRRLRR